MKDHEKAALVNALTAIAKQYGQAQQLRERIAHYVLPELDRAVREEREACAMVCEKTGEEPSSLWEEPGCWIQASETCAFAIRMRSNGEVRGASLKGEASSAEGATSTVVLEGRKDDA